VWHAAGAKSSCHRFDARRSGLWLRMHVPTRQLSGGRFIGHTHDTATVLDGCGLVGAKRALNICLHQ